VRRVVVLLGTLVLAAGMALTPSCPLPDPILENDAGDAAWVERATLFLWGRRTESPREAAVLTRLVEQSDRASVARAMLRSPEYIERWQDFVYDALAVPRAGDRARSVCWDVSLLDEHPGTALAVHVRDASAADAGSFAQEFTLRDLTRSTLELDDLSVIYRAALFPPLTTWFEPPNLLEAAAERRMMAESFVRTHLDRNLECLPCHNSEASVTDAGDPEIDRSWPLPGHVEAGVFGVSEGRDINDLALHFRRRGVVFGFGFDDSPAPNRDYADVVLDGCTPNPDQAGCLGCGCEETVCAQDPSCCADSWTEACAEACVVSGEPCRAPLPEGFDGCGAVLGGSGGCDGCACEEEVCEADPACCEELWDGFCALNCRERYPRCPWYAEAHLADAVAPWGWHLECGIFDAPEDVADDISGTSGFFVRDTGAAASMWDLEASLARGVERVRARGLVVADDGTVDGEAGFAWLVGMGIADRVWKEAFGARLTLSHHLARNIDQRDRLMALTTAFVRGGFSLRDLLVRVVEDPLFNQRSPAAVEATSPYYLPPVLDPWTIEEDEETVRGNTVADGLHVLSPRVRLRAVEHALGWEPGPSFAVFETDFHNKLYSGIGVFLKDSEPGFDAQGLQPMLTWEQHVGGCRDPGHRPEGPGCEAGTEPGCGGCDCAEIVCLRTPACCEDAWTEQCAEDCRLTGSCFDGPSDPDDWIAALVAEIERRTEAGTGTTWEQAIATLKGRLVGEPWLLDDAERAATEALLGHALTDRPTGDVEEPLRRVCGALLMSPQFLLQGLPPTDAPEEPTAPIVVPGTSFQEHCEALAVAMYADGSLDCSSGGAVLR